MTISEQYKQDGYYIAKRLLSTDCINGILENLKNTFDDQLETLGSQSQKDIYSSMKLLHKTDVEKYKKTAGSLWRKLSIYNLLHHNHIQNFVLDNFGWKDIVIPGGQVVLIMADSLKIPGGYFGFQPHQDYPSVQGSKDGFVVWIPLVDIDKNRYPLELIPGSHTKGILPSYEHNEAGWVVKPECYNEQDFIPVECQIGDVIFLSNFTVHRSSITGDDRLRLACSTRYDNADESTFIKRCYPTAYMRTVHRALLHPEDV